ISPALRRLQAIGSRLASGLAERPSRASWRGTGRGDGRVPEASRRHRPAQRSAWPGRAARAGGPARRRLRARLAASSALAGGGVPALGGVFRGSDVEERLEFVAEVGLIEIARRRGHGGDGDAWLTVQSLGGIVQPVAAKHPLGRGAYVVTEQ